MVGSFYRIALLIMWVVVSVEGVNSSEAQRHDTDEYGSAYAPYPESREEVLKNIYSDAQSTWKSTAAKIGVLLAGISAGILIASETATTLGVGGVVAGPLTTAAVATAAAGPAAPIVGFIVAAGLTGRELVHYNRCRKRCSNAGFDTLINLYSELFPQGSEATQEISQKKYIEIYNKAQEALKGNPKDPYQDNPLQCMLKCRKYFKKIDYIEKLSLALFNKLAEKKPENQKNPLDTPSTNTPQCPTCSTEGSSCNICKNTNNKNQETCTKSTCVKCRDGNFCGSEACKAIEFTAGVLNIPVKKTIKKTTPILDSENETDVIVDNTVVSLDDDNDNDNEGTEKNVKLDPQKVKEIEKEIEVDKKKLKQELEKLKNNSETLLGNILIDIKNKNQSVFGSIKEFANKVLDDMSNTKSADEKPADKNCSNLWDGIVKEYTVIACDDLKNIRTNMEKKIVAFNTMHETNYDIYRKQKGPKRIFYKTFDQFHRWLFHNYVEFIIKRRVKMSCLLSEFETSFVASSSSVNPTNLCRTVSGGGTTTSSPAPVTHGATGTPNPLGRRTFE